MDQCCLDIFGNGIDRQNFVVSHTQACCLLIQEVLLLRKQNNRRRPPNSVRPAPSPAADSDISDLASATISTLRCCCLP